MTPVTYEIERATPTQTHIRCVDALSVPEVAAKLPIWQRARPLVQRGPKLVTELAASLDAEYNSVLKAVNRSKLYRVDDDSSGNKIVSLTEWRYGR